jgi:plasmid stabilization system protein ParE
LKPVILSDHADADIVSAAFWYESQRENLGAKFLDRVDEALKVIERNPEGPQQIMPNLRHVHLRKFKPYSLWYTVVNEVLVLACMHGKRRLGPVVWSRYKGLKP